MNCYLINLDRARERYRHISELFNRKSINLVRVPAIDGACLHKDEIAYWQSRNRIWSPMLAPEIGCFLSHRCAWTLVAEGEEPWAFVCEDDIHITEDFSKFVETSDWLPKLTDIVKAETMCLRVEMATEEDMVAFGHSLRRLKSEHLGAAGYFISREVAKKLMDLTADCCEPADCILFSPRGSIAPLLTVHQLDPALCIQDFHLAGEGEGIGFASQIQLDKRLKAKPAGLQQRSNKLLRELRRPIKQLEHVL